MTVWTESNAPLVYAAIDTGLAWKDVERLAVSLLNIESARNELTADYNVPETTNHITTLVGRR